MRVIISIRIEHMEDEEVLKLKKDIEEIIAEIPNAQLEIHMS